MPIMIGRDAMPQIVAPYDPDFERIRTYLQDISEQAELGSKLTADGDSLPGHRGIMTLSMDVVSGYWALAGQPLDDDARRAAKIALADGLAVMIAAARLEPATRPFADYATSVGEQGRSTIIATGEKRSAASAALANGALAHALDFEDTFEAGMIHPNASLIPAVLALAQSEVQMGRL